MLAAGFAIAAYPVLAVDQLAPLLSLPGGVGAALLAAAVFTRRTAPLPWALGLLAAQYLASLYIRGVGLHGGAPVYAGCLLALGEGAYLGIDLGRHRFHPAQLAERCVLLAGAGFGAAGLGYLLLLVAALPVEGDVVLTGIGVAGAVGALAALAALARAKASIKEQA